MASSPFIPRESDGKFSGGHASSPYAVDGPRRAGRRAGPGGENPDEPVDHHCDDEEFGQEEERRSAQARREDPGLAEKERGRGEQQGGRSGRRHRWRASRRPRWRRAAGSHSGRRRRRARRIVRQDERRWIGTPSGSTGDAVQRRDTGGQQGRGEWREDDMGRRRCEPAISPGLPANVIQRSPQRSPGPPNAFIDCGSSRHGRSDRAHDQHRDEKTLPASDAPGRLSEDQSRHTGGDADDPPPMCSTAPRSAARRAVGDFQGQVQDHGW